MAFEYTYGTVSPNSAVLLSPDGTEHKPDYFNDDRDGRIVFTIDKPEGGEWNIRVSDDVKLGEYSVHVLGYMDYMDAIAVGERVEYDPGKENLDPVSVNHTTKIQPASTSMPSEQAVTGIKGL